MLEEEYTLDARALEIILLAFGFLSLICFFAIVILTGAKIRRASDAERGGRAAAWGATWWPEDEHHPQEPYQDETFIDCVRRQSANWASDIKEELSCLTERLVPKRISDDPSPLDLVAEPLHRMSGQGLEERRRSLLEVRCEQVACDVEGSPATASRRDGGDDKSRRRSMRTEARDFGDACDLDSKDSQV